MARRPKISPQKLRLSSRAVIDAIGCETKQVGSIMRSAGWSGPKTLRFPDGTGKSKLLQGYAAIGGL